MTRDAGKVDLEVVLLGEGAVGTAADTQARWEEPTG
jgi:hypothetical protein